MFTSLGRFIVQRRRLVLVASITALVVAAVIGTGVFSRLDGGGFDDPNSESTRAAELLAEYGARPAAGDESALWQLDGDAKRLLFIGHGGSDAVALTRLLGLQPVPWEWDRFVSQHASITVLRSRRIAGSHIFALRSFSAVDHLPRDLRST